MIREEWSYLLFILAGLLLLDFTGVFSLTKPSNMKVTIKKLLKNKYNFLSTSIEFAGIALLFLSFGLPWYYYYECWIGGSCGITYFTVFENSNFSYVLLFLINTAYLIGVFIIVLKILIKKKLSMKSSLELIELIILMLGIIFMVNIEFLDCEGPFIIPERFCFDSGYSVGYFLYVLGIIVLFSNGVQMSVYPRLKKSEMILLIP
ncbi:MAG: hypothetical protein EU550_01030 [Promethearchaeota archaeon]|nr:MAG: hypothetical protein EU550_01030 [Candidatus Lokiarchaeota archaeon]